MILTFLSLEKVVPISIILLFRIREFEEVAAFLPQVEEAVSDVSKFSSVMFLFYLLDGKADGNPVAINC